MSSVRVVTGAQVNKILSSLDPSAILTCQEAVFEAHSMDVSTKPPPIQMPQRLTVSSEDTTMLFMPSRAPTSVPGQSSEGSKTQSTTAIKIVSVPTKGAEGLPASTFVMDETTGKVKAMINARKLTALRNAAGSAIFLSSFPCPTPPAHMALFGAGAQCVAHAILLLRLHPSITKVDFIVRSNNARSEEAVSNLSAQFPQVQITAAVHADASSAGLTDLLSTADIIITATSSTVPLFHHSPTVPKAGSRLVLIGSYKPTMHEVDTATIQNAGIVVDTREACLTEAGELIDAGLRPEDLVELGQVISQRHASEQHSARDQVLQKAGGPEGVVIFKSVGMGIQDVAIASLVLAEAERLNLGTVVDDYD
ncbi:hypothetical protein IAU60_000439 [Kwoniella sp. DSM 27419]